MQGLVPGRIVNFCDESGGNYPAIVSAVLDDETGECVLYVFAPPRELSLRQREWVLVAHTPLVRAPFGEGPWTWEWISRE